MEQPGSENSFSILDTVIFLKKTALFSRVHTSELRAVATIIEELDYDDGKVIVEENDLGDTMYIIKEGTVVVRKKSETAGPIVLATMGKGDCFGEMAIFGDEIRTATVVAQGTCSIYRISRDHLLDVILEYPHIAIEMLKVFTRRLNAANKKIKDLSTRPAENEK